MMATLLLAILLQAQPARPPAAASNDTGTVRGRVTAAESGRPLKRANVRLQSSDGAAVRIQSSTNAQGRFEIANVPPGQYTLQASRGGYLPLQYGQRYQTQRGATIEVTAASAIEKIDIALPRAGVIGGRITDELGEPYPNVAVEVLTSRIVNGKRTMSQVNGATTNDIGQFRIGGLWPGTYFVVALSTEAWLNEREETLGYGSTYYPGVTAGAAQSVTLAASQQRLDLDFSMLPSRAVKISGHVQAEVPGRPAPTGIALAYTFGDGILTYGMRNTRLQSDGSFEFKDVTSGTYQLYGGGTDATLTVADADVGGLVLVSRVGSSVTGRVVTEDGVPPPFGPSGIRVELLAPYGKVLPTTRVSNPDADWWFRMQSLGGPFLFRISGLPPDWVLGTVKLGERDITDAPWDVPTGARQLDGLTIVLTRKIGRVAGVVTTSDGKPAASATAILFAEDEKLWMPGSRFVRTARPDKDGVFSLSGLPAGTYRAAAREFVEEGAWDDPAFLEQLRDSAARFVLTEGGSQSLTLKLPAPK